MAAAGELKAEDFFASRAGVCVYVTVGKRVLRVQFATPGAHGVVAESTPEDAAEALRVASAALQEHAAAVAPLFARVTRKMT